MTATERGRRSDSLYYDNVSRRELCDKIAFLETDLKEAKEELAARERAMEPDGWHNCTNDERTNGTCRKVYLVETSDELIESWFPFGVYLHREAAEDCAEALRREDDGILCFARVSELKVVD